MNARRLIAAVAVGLFLVAGWLVVRQSIAPTGINDPAIPPASADIPTPSGASPTPASTTPSAIDVGEKPPQQLPDLTPSATRTLRAILAAPREIAAGDFTALAGVARLTTEARREYEIFLNDPAAQAGPSHINELAELQEWIEAPLADLGDGRLMFGPVEVPAAEVYHILAFDAEGHYFWQPVDSTADLEIDAGTIHESSRTGISLRLVNAPAGETDYLLGIERRPSDVTAEQTSALLQVLPKINPALADALIEQLPMIIPAGEDILMAPMCEDPAVRLTVRLATGQPAPPVEVGLLRGKIVPVTLDVQRLFSSEEARTIDLRGRVVLAGDDEPVVNAVVRVIDSVAAPVETDENGEFILADIPYSAESQLAIEVMRPPFGLPLTREEHQVAINPRDHAASDAQEFQFKFELPAYKWLIVQFDDSVRAAVEERSKFPYPIYMLQRTSTGHWRDIAADEFIPVEEGIAISLIAENTVRAAVAISPVEVHYSESVEAGTAAETRVPITTGALQTVPQLAQLIDMRTKAPLANARVRLAAAHRSLPPMEVYSDAQGKINIGAMNVEPLIVHASSELLGSGEAIATLDELRENAFVIEVPTE